MKPDTGPAQNLAGKPVRILVAEDSPLNRQVALKQLEKLGYQADAVSDGAQVLEALSRNSYDIILMDCRMPGMSGYEAAWQIRNLEKKGPEGTPQSERIYIIAMTANAEADNREKCRLAGMDGFINKPVQLAELEASLLRALAAKAALGTNEEVIDPVVIVGLRQLASPGKPDPVAELIDLFLQEAPQQLDAMENAIAENDSSSLSQTISAATALKGSAGNLGARNLAALCDEIEQAAKTAPLVEAKPLVDRARQEFAHARQTLETIKASSSSASKAA
jgi:CheY-like chemotaxis protein